jgi:hypothetical protein
MSARDELAELIASVTIDTTSGDVLRVHPDGETPVFEGDQRTADAILDAGYRKIFDGDCGLSNVKDPTEKEAAEAWMRWANLASNEDIGAIGAMQIMLTEFGYRKPRTITTAEELDALPVGSVILDPAGLSLHKNEYTGWRASNGAKDIPADMLVTEALPATILWKPIP